ncbi:hypothetical protein Bca4012_056046 [Brassica carinata]
MPNMSTLNQLFDLPGQICHVQCGFCTTILLVSVPFASLSMVVTVRCGHCTSLLSVNLMKASFLPLHLLTSLCQLDEVPTGKDEVAATTDDVEEETLKVNQEKGNSPTTLVTSSDNEDEDQDVSRVYQWAHFPPVQNKRAASDQCFCEEDDNVLLSCNALERLYLRRCRRSFIPRRASGILVDKFVIGWRFIEAFAYKKSPPRKIKRDSHRRRNQNSISIPLHTTHKLEEMGSEGPKEITIHVTGFKKFLGVSENPTEKIANNLKSYVEKRGLPCGLSLGSCTVLETAGEGAKSQLYQVLESSVVVSGDKSTNGTVVWLHLGVNSGATKFAIERQAVNEAHFRCPDQLGWQPQTSCSTESIFKSLKSKGFDVVQSDDAGRFVCNYVYYHSLRHMMDKLFILSLIALLTLTAYGAAGKMVYTDLDILKKLENFDIPEDVADDDYDTKSFTSRGCGKNLVNVDTFGAAGDGVSDDTQIDGTIVAPDEPSNWDPKFQRIWLEFSKLKGVVFQGNGVIDGSGSKWWAASCKKNKSNAFTIESSSGVKVKGLTIQNSQQMNFIIARSKSVRVYKVMVSSPGDSPNTDGIHITGSTNVVLQDCKIGTGDDCVSIVNASSNIKMKRIYCGPGHGISIGSLGNHNSTGIVTKVVLDTAFLKETTNGLRIKTYQGGSGYVKGVRFSNVVMQDVSNPILIDQFYCDNPTSCQNQTSAVKISQIMYRNITGTTKSEKAIKFACSDSVPCSHIVLNNVNLEGRDGQVEAYCNSAEGFGYGVIHPSADCLYSHDDKGLDQSGKSGPVLVTEEAESGHDEL